MLILEVKPQSVASVESYVDRVREQIFVKMREGMQEAMQGLAIEAVAQAGEAGIQARTGQFFSDVLKSPRVRETAEVITGRVNVESEMTSGGRKFRGYLGTALDEGFHVPGEPSDKTRGPFQFTASDGDTLYARGHVAFDVRPHPFLRRAREAYTQPILDIIAAKVAEAYEV